MSAMWAFVIVELDPLSDPGEGVRSDFPRTQLAHAYFRNRQSRSTKMLSRKRPLPSNEIRTADQCNRSVQAKDVNWLPWSVFMMSGTPDLAMAWLSAPTQKSASSLFNMRQASTLRVYQTRIATRYRKPRRIGIYVMSFDHCTRTNGGDGLTPDLIGPIHP